MQDECSGDVDEQANDADDEHEPAVDVYLVVVRETFDCLPYDPASNDPEAQGIDCCRQHFGALIAESALDGLGPTGDSHGHQRKGDGRGVGEYVACVGKEGEAS